ncbi:putative dual-specificity protein phosphatase [Trypanosoma cruzi]|uniref:protein-tyrosine-phosphatase n=2 Tax=Trypanosoma cruzi TaxID=5693 RepID=A0A2V2X2Z9_TRYCR|nr:putative dual-specificity protein phosphatase [Trypanosoma cruzi]
MNAQPFTAASDLPSPPPPPPSPLPPPPAFARGGYHSNGVRGSGRLKHNRRHHRFSDKNVVDLCRLDRSSSSSINDNKTRSNRNSNSHSISRNSNRKNGSDGTPRGCIRAPHSSQPPTPAQKEQQQCPSTHGSSSSLLSSCTTVLPYSSLGKISSFSTCGREPPTKILDFLYIGGVRDATNAEFLRRENIVTILNVSREEYWSVDRSIVIHPFAVDDTTEANIQQFFRPTHVILEQVRKAYYDAKQRGASVCPRALVHCQRGKSRSVTIVLAYLIYRNGWTVAEALQYVTRRRPRVEPNLGFIDALRAYQESMDVEERTRRCSSLGLAVRNLPRDTASSFVHKFFEDHVGCVQEVMMHSSRPNQSRNIAAPNTNGVDQGKRGNDDNDPPASFGLSGRRDGNSSSGIAVKTCSNDADGNTLCLVFFSAAECVRLAKLLYMRRPELFNVLGVVDGKELRLTIPSKLIRLSRTAHAHCDDGDNTRSKKSSQGEEDTPKGDAEKNDAGT